MNYKEYLNLGFKRVNLDDNVEECQTGYKGYFLFKRLSSRMYLEVYYREMNEPILVIKPKDKHDLHIQIRINEHQCRDLAERA